MIFTVAMHVFCVKKLQIINLTLIFAPLLKSILAYSVMVTLQILVLSFLVRIQVGQHNELPSIGRLVFLSSRALLFTLYRCFVFIPEKHRAHLFGRKIDIYYINQNLFIMKEDKNVSPEMEQKIKDVIKDNGRKDSKKEVSECEVSQDVNMINPDVNTLDRG